MCSIFSGGILSNFLLGEPILGVFKNSNSLMLATVVWYLIFYSPFDMIYRFCKFLPVKIILATMKEVIRCKKVHDGVAHAAKLYPSGYVIMAMVGTIKGNGAAFMRLIERILRGVWTPNAVEIMAPTFATKASLAASIIFIIDKKTDYISVPHSLIYFGIVIFFAYFKLSSMLLGIHDPFVPFENLFCAIFMGGVWDALAHVLANGNFRGIRPLNHQAAAKPDLLCFLSKIAKKGDDNPKVEIPRREEAKKKD